MAGVKNILKNYVIFKENDYWTCSSCQHCSSGHPNRIIAHLTRISRKGIKVCPNISPKKMEELKRELRLGSHSTDADGQQLQQAGEKNDIMQEKGNKKMKGSKTSGSDAPEMPPLGASDSSVQREIINLKNPPSMFFSSQKDTLEKYVIFQENKFWRCRLCQHRCNGHRNRLIAHLLQIRNNNIKVCPEISPGKMEELRRELGLGPIYPSPFRLRLKRPRPSGLLSFDASRESNMGIPSPLIWRQGGVGDQGIQSLNFQGFGVAPWTQHSGASQFPNVNGSNSLDLLMLQQQILHLIQMVRRVDEVGFNPPTTTFVKVHMSRSWGRYMDISKFTSYDELCNDLEGQLEKPQRSRETIITDQTNNVRIVVLSLGPDFVDEGLITRTLSLLIRHKGKERITANFSVSERSTWSSQNLEKFFEATICQKQSSPLLDASWDVWVHSSQEHWLVSMKITLEKHTPPNVPNSNNDGFQDTSAAGSEPINTIRQGLSSQLDSTQISFTQGGPDLGMGDPIPTPPNDQGEAHVPNTNNDGFQDTSVVGSELIDIIHRGQSSLLDSTQISSLQVGLDLGVGDPIPTPPHGQGEAHVPNTNNDGFQDTIVVGPELIDIIHRGQSSQLDSTQIFSLQGGLDLGMGDPIPTLPHDQGEAHVPNTNNDEFQGTSVVGSELIDIIHRGQSSQLDSTQISSLQGGLDLGVGDLIHSPPHACFDYMINQHTHLLQDGVQSYISSHENASCVEMATPCGVADLPPCSPGFDPGPFEFYDDIWN